MQLSPLTSSRTFSSLLAVLTLRHCSFFLEHPTALQKYVDTYYLCYSYRACSCSLYVIPHMHSVRHHL